MTPEEHVAWMRRHATLNRLTTLADVGHAAAFLASDQGAALTGTGINLTCGTIATR
jgi:enoyl-[acyl-carrier-protein] reductase (NADH)